MNLTEIKNIQLFLFDMDGTLYLGDQLYDFTKELLQKIRSAGRPARLLGDSAERAGSQEDKEHNGDIVIADALGADMDLLVETEGTVLREGNRREQAQKAKE